MSTPQSVLDALADAETLRRNLKAQPAGWKVAGWTRVRINETARLLTCADMARWPLGPATARAAASAAFLAVPGLRG